MWKLVSLLIITLFFKAVCFITIQLILNLFQTVCLSEFFVRKYTLSLT